MTRLAVALVCVAACGKRAPETPVEKVRAAIERIDDRVESGEAVAFVRPAGVYHAEDAVVAADLYVDGRVVPSADRRALVAALRARGPGQHSIVVLGEPASAPLVATLLACHDAGWQEVWVARVDGDSFTPYGLFKPTRRPPAELTLSTWIQADKIWVGLSGVNDFTQVTSTDQLRDVMRNYTASSQLKDRHDAELGFDPGLPTTRVLEALHAVGDSYGDLAILLPAELAARPEL